MLRLDIVCPLCQGQQKIQCKTCNGTGKLKSILGFIPKHCPNCNKTGFVKCVCITEGEQVKDLFWNSGAVTNEQKQIAIAFLQKYDSSLVIKILEKLVFQISQTKTSFLFDLLNYFGWDPTGCEDKRLFIRYALVKRNTKILQENSHNIEYELRWFISDFSDSEKINYVIDLVFLLNEPVTLYVLKEIIINCWSSLTEKHSSIITFLANNDIGLEILVDVFKNNPNIYEYCCGIRNNPQLLKAFGKYAFNSSSMSKNNITKMIFFLGDDSTQEAINISKQLHQNDYIHYSSLYCRAAELLMKREDEVINLLDFIAGKKTSFFNEPEIGLLKTLSNRSDGGEYLLNSALECFSYDDAQCATNYLEYLLTFKKNKLSKSTLDGIAKLEFREFETGGISTHYMPGAFGGSYSTGSPKKTDIISFKHIKKRYNITTCLQKHDYYAFTTS